jgi:EpsI family protein
VLAWVGLVATALAHRDLLRFRPRTTLAVPLTSDVENWFFEPSDTSPALVLVLVLWLLWRRRGRLARTAGSKAVPGLSAGLFALGLGVFFWAVRTGTPELQALSLLFNTLGVAHAFGGVAALRIAAVPAAFLVFAVPLPAPLLNEVVWTFQIWTADYSGFLLHLLGQPAFVSGDQILQSDKAFQIIESCSGMRSIETLTMLAVLMVDLFQRRRWHAVLLLLAAPPVAFMMNGFRALTLIFNPHSDIASVHNLQGIVMLLGGVLVLYALDGLLDRLLPHRDPPAPARPGPGISGTARLRIAWGGSLAAVAGLLGLSMLPVWTLAIPPGPQLSDQLPRELAGFQSRDVATDRIFLGQVGFSQILHREYAGAGARVDVFVARAAQRLRGRSFHSPKTLVPGSGWIVEEGERRQIGGRAVDVRVVRRGTRRLLVYHWREGTRGLRAETLRTVAAIDASPWRRSEVPVVIRLTTPIAARSGSLEAAEAHLGAFLERIGPYLAPMSLGAMPPGEVGSPGGG